MKIHYYKRIYLVKNWFPKFCPLYQEIPLLRDTLLQEATVDIYQLNSGKFGPRLWEALDLLRPMGYPT